MTAASAEGRAGLIGRIVGWLRQGYPTGVPQSDYVALLGILRRALTEDEITQVVHSLVTEGPTDDGDVEERIRAEVRKQILQNPSDEDVARVSAKLAAAGWPLAGTDDPS